MPVMKLKAGNYLIPVNLIDEGNQFALQFPFSRELIPEIKSMNGAKWHGNDEKNPRKIWTISKDPRNLFQLDYLAGKNPYARYDAPLPVDPFPPRHNLSLKKIVPPFNHQNGMSWHFVTRRHCICAGEMGTGKTLAVFNAIEKTGETDIWYVAPKLGIEAVKREFRIWGFKNEPKWLTYEGVVKLIKDNAGSQFTPPKILILDESSKVKNPNSQRAQACKQIADGMREDYGNSCYIWLMSGTPAPKSPIDWWMQAEIACPGFLKEGDIHKFKNTLGIIVKRSTDLGSYPHLVSWKNNEQLCDVCGQLIDNPIHDKDAAFVSGLEYHSYQKSINEVERLYRRLKGLVFIALKKDCLDLPEKQYRIIELKPTASLVRASKTLVKAASTVIEGLTLLRELSDGFQYKKIPQGKEQCSRCHGSKKAIEYAEIPGTCPTCKGEFVGQYGQNTCPNHLPERKETIVECSNCDENGQVDKYTRTVQTIPCPKYETLKELLLEEFDEVGRVVIYGGFTGTIDRCIDTCHTCGWTTIRLDQGTVVIQDKDNNVLNEKDYLSLFQDKQDEHPKVAFVATQGSGGMSATLTASPVIINVSNGFNGQDRMQSEDRIHRPGLDPNRGATIIDLIHLPSDKLVLENLQKKKDLQAMSLGDVTKAIDSTETRVA